jgi:glucokinase
MTDCCNKYAVGVDLGGTKILTAISDRKGNIITRVTLPTLANEGVEAVVGRIKDSIRQAIDESGIPMENVAGIGVCAPGAINTRTGVVLESPNLPDWHNVPLREMIGKEFGLPVYLDNDANVAGLAEAFWGAGKGCRNILYLTVSTGIGGGIIHSGQIYRGSHDFAGEVGHVTLQHEGGPECGCGNTGCLEALASGTAITRMAKEAIAAGRQSKILDLADGDIDKITTVIVSKALKEGDELAREIVAKAAMWLGIGTASFVNLFDPDMIVIGGGTSNIGEPLFAPVREIVQKRSMKAICKNVEIVPAKCGGDVGVLGALSLVFSEMGISEAV